MTTRSLLAFTLALSACAPPIRPDPMPMPPPDPGVPPPVLAAIASVDPATVSAGQAFTVTVGQDFAVDVTVLNAGQATARLVSPALDTGMHAAVFGVPAPGAATIASGETQTFHLTVRASTEDTLLFTATAAGLDANSGL